MLYIANGDLQREAVTLEALHVCGQSRSHGRIMGTSFSPGLFVMWGGCVSVLGSAVWSR